MLPMKIKTVCKALEGKLVQGDDEREILGVMARWAYVKPGYLYFDVVGGPGGNRNMLQALENGATAFVISKYKKTLPFDDKEVAVVAVPKVWEAFWKFVAFYRELFNIPVIGVTGTSGKTTTKEMLAAILSRKWRVMKTRSNLNLPDFVPGHIFRIRKSHGAAVFEIGMNGPGQIGKQSRAVKPNIGIITHIGQGHVGAFNNKEEVIKEKSDIMVGIPAGGHLLLNADDPNTAKISLTGFAGQVHYFGLKNKAEITAHDIRCDAKGTRFKVKAPGLDEEFFIPTFGRHNVSNALAAILAARLAGVEKEHIKNGLAKYRKPHMRLQVVKGIRETLLINDTYNANPDSVIAGLDVLKLLAAGRKTVAVLGNMLEQGQYSVEAHRRVGEKATALQLDLLVTVGWQAREIARGAVEAGMPKEKVISFMRRLHAEEYLKKAMPEKAVVLFKGSRGAYLEKLVKALKAPKEND
ncbi:MAG: UDP-N-acetylmuramoyl-tripeptide--D-alanyl-D-alanine ligase [Bacillota bacterium]